MNGILVTSTPATSSSDLRDVAGPSVLEQFPLEAYSKCISAIARLGLSPEPIFLSGADHSTLAQNFKNGGVSELIRNAYKIISGDTLAPQPEPFLSADEELFKRLGKIRIWYQLQFLDRSKSGSALGEFVKELARSPITSTAKRVSSFRALIGISSALPSFNVSDVESAVQVATSSFPFEGDPEHISMPKKRLQVEGFNAFLERFAEIDLKFAQKADKFLGLKCLPELVKLSTWIKNAYNESRIEFLDGKDHKVRVTPPAWGADIIPEYIGSEYCVFTARAKALLQSPLGNDCLRAVVSLGLVLTYCKEVGLATSKELTVSSFDFKPNRFGQEEAFSHDPICLEPHLFFADKFLETSDSPSLELKWDTIWNETLYRSWGIPFLPSSHRLSDELISELRREELLIPSGMVQHPLNNDSYGDRLVWNPNKILIQRDSFEVRYLNTWGTTITDVCTRLGTSQEERTELKRVLSCSGVQGFGRFELGKEKHVAIITAANASGKSTFLGAVRHAIHAHQTGRKVLASSAKLSVVDKIFTDQPDLESVVDDRSRLQAQVASISEFLTQGTPRSLGLFDELFHGTSAPYQLALAWAVLEEAVNRGLHAIVTTHVGELTCFGTENGLAAIKGIFSRGRKIVNLSREIDPAAKAVNFSISDGFKMSGGAVLDSDAISAARSHGLPESVLIRAKELVDWVTK